MNECPKCKRKGMRKSGVCKYCDYNIIDEYVTRV